MNLCLCLVFCTKITSKIDYTHRLRAQATVVWNDVLVLTISISLAFLLRIVRTKLVQQSNKNRLSDRKGLATSNAEWIFPH